MAAGRSVSASRSCATASRLYSVAWRPADAIAPASNANQSAPAPARVITTYLTCLKLVKQVSLNNVDSVLRCLVWMRRP